MNDNEQTLIRFREFLDSADPVAAIAANLGRARLVAVVREFAETIDPVPLAEATNREMSIFASEHGRNAAQQQLNGCRAQLARANYEMAMLAFKAFRREVLRGTGAQSLSSKRRPELRSEDSDDH